MVLRLQCTKKEVFYQEVTIQLHLCLFCFSTARQEYHKTLCEGERSQQQMPQATEIITIQMLSDPKSAAGWH